ncbi:MAG TPA: FtsX-like permease family protein [Mycobacteriales bacterium]|nr:FtsX-like permease family protein [Mycobacteriales bacterium]
MRLLGRALRWRARASVATALLAAVTVLAAVVGPLWTRAGSESILRDTLVTAGRTQDAAIFQSQEVADQEGLDFVRAGATTTPLPHYGPPIEGIRLLTDTQLPGGGTLRVRHPLLWREGFCVHVLVLTGRCPSAAGEVMLHRITAQRLKARLGTVVHAAYQGVEDRFPGQPMQERVVGSYVLKDARSTYWAGDGDTAFQSGLGGTDGLTDLPDRVPATLTVPETFAALSRGTDGDRIPQATVSVTRLLDVDHVRLADVPALRLAVERAGVAVVAASTEQRALVVFGNVVFQLDAAEADGEELGRASTIVLAQLVLLAAVVLVLVLSASGAARAPEIAAARLRGLRTRTVVQLALGEPVVLVLLGTPLGALGGLLLVQAMAAARLRDGTPVAIGTGAVEALALALVALLAAVALVCGRALGTPVLLLWQRTDKPPSRFALAAELLAAVVLAGAGYGCTQGGSPWELLTPVPVSLAVALLGLRLLPLLFLPAVRRTRARRNVASFLAVRQLVRRREGSWLTGLLVVAFGLAATATASWSVANGAAKTRARAEVGAPVVYLVQPDLQHPDLDLRSAVRAADPSGRRAMAVLEYLPFANDPGGRLLVVDSDRLAAVTFWDEQVQGGRVADVVAALKSPSGSFASAVVTAEVSRDPLSLQRSDLPPNGAVITDVTSLRRTVVMRKVVAALPRGLDVGSMMDFDSSPAVDNASVAALLEVWTTTKDPALKSSLEHHGIQVLAREDASGRQAVLSRQGPGLAVLLSLVAAGLALLLAAASTLFSVLTSARRRGWELAALASVGVSENVLRRSSRRESLLLLGVGLAMGAIAGVIACVATLRSIPYFADATSVRLSLRPDPAPLAVLLVVAVGLIVVTSGLVGRALHRAADPARLRELQA